MVCLNRVHTRKWAICCTHTSVVIDHLWRSVAYAAGNLFCSRLWKWLIWMVLHCIRCPTRLCRRFRSLQLCRWSSAVPTEDPSLCIYLDNWRLTDMDYAHDIALFSPSSDEMCSVVSILSKEAAKVGMSISRTKTKAMMISSSSAITTPMNIDGELVEFVPSFTYLDSVISADGSIEAYINFRIGKAAGGMKRLSNALWKRRCISRQTQLIMCRALVSSVLLYGSETWNLTTSDCNRLKC